MPRISRKFSIIGGARRRIILVISIIWMTHRENCGRSGTTTGSD